MSPQDDQPKQPRRKRRLLPVISLIVLGLIVSLWFFVRSDFVSRDACLDSGGRWGDGSGCEFAQDPE